MSLRIARAAAAALVLMALPLAFTVGTAWGQSPAKPAAAPAAGGAKADPVVAVVNGTQIHLSDVDAARQDLPPQYQQVPLDAVYRPLLDRVIDGKLLSAEGRKEGLANDPEVKAWVARIEDQVIRSVYLERQIKAQLTDAALQKRYQDFLKSNPPEPERSVRHILVKTEAEAKDIIKQLEAGADFAELAKKDSTGPSAARGGDLGYIKRGDVVPEFADAAFKLKPGEYTKTPVKTQFGWHIIKVDSERMSAPPSFEQAKEELSQQASRDIAGEIVAKLRKDAKIERFNPDGTPLKEEPAKSGNADKPAEAPANK